jgi:hypothetical protein
MLPIESNQGEPFPDALLGRYSARFAEICGGAFGTRGEGIWTDPRSGICYREPMLALDSDAESHPELAAELHEIARAAARDFAQVGIYLRIGERVDIVAAV